MYCSCRYSPELIFCYLITGYHENCQLKFVQVVPTVLTETVLSRAVYKKKLLETFYRRWFVVVQIFLCAGQVAPV